MSTMPLARIHAPNDIRIDEIERPVPGPDDVLVRGRTVRHLRFGPQLRQDWWYPGCCQPVCYSAMSSPVSSPRWVSNVRHFHVGDHVVVNPTLGETALAAPASRAPLHPISSSTTRSLILKGC